MALKSSTSGRFVTMACKAKLFLPSSFTLVKSAYPLKVVSLWLMFVYQLALVIGLFHWASYGKD